MTVKLRFAPSPTGLIHVGNIRTALMNALFCRQNGGTFLLRLDDTDLERSTDAFAAAIGADLQWLGLTYDDCFKQSQRMDRYHTVKQQLIDMGRLYPCYESADELERKRKKALARKMPPVYDRASLALTDAEKQAYESEGRTAHWRFKLDLTDIHFHDLIRGDVRIDARSVSDPVLIREDGSFLYTLCSVIDDMDYGISHIIRGEDHVTNTAVQIQIFEALGYTIPTFAHHPLLTDSTGEKLSKRLGGLSVQSLREQGLEPMTILSYLARIGTSDSVVPCTDIEALIKGFDITRTSNSPARFVSDDMLSLNGTILGCYDSMQVTDRLEKTLGTSVPDNFWDCVKFNLSIFNDVQTWHTMMAHAPENISLPPHEQDFIKTAIECLPAVHSKNLWQEWTQKLKEQTGRKGKDLFMPLRLALTGMNHGPEMAVVINLLSLDAMKQRLLNVHFDAETA